MIRALRVALGLQLRSAPFASLIACVLAIATGLAATSGGWLLRELLDEVAHGSAAAADRAVALVVAAAAVVGVVAAIGHAGVYVNDHIRWRVTATVERTLFEKVGGLVGMRELETPAFQSKLRLAQEAALEAPQQISHLLLAVVTGAVAIASAIVAVCLVMPSMLWLLVLAAAIELAAQLYCSRQQAALEQSLADTHRWRDYHRGLVADLQAAKEIRVFGLRDLLLDRLLGGLRRVSRRELALGRTTMLLRAGLALLGATVTVAGAASVVKATIRGEAHVGDVALFLAAVAGVQSATSALFWELGNTARSALVFRNYLEIVELPEPPAAPRDHVPPLAKGIELRDAWFRYRADGPWILRGVDLRIPAGSTLGLVGVNGAGKTTLIKLLCRLWDLEQGQILWDGVDIREFDPAALRRRIAATFQDFTTYDATIGDNIAFGDVHRLGDTFRVRTAAKVTEIDDKLAALGYDTPLGRRLADGAALSGGELQRVALARSLFRRADLLILDEPSSGLDAGAEYRLQRNIGVHVAGTTRVLVSHRLSTLREADQIAVLADGRIVERGTHDELMARRGTYAGLFSMQARGYQDARVAS